MTDPPERPYRWRGWHLHAGSLDPATLDRLLTDAVAPAIENTATPPVWFFVRYWLHGPHLRLRVADLDDACASAVETTLRASAVRVEAAIPPDGRADDDAYRRSAAPLAASGEAGTAIDPGHLRAAGVYPETYQPETDRYGGAALMPTSERLFHASSVTALDVCRQGRGTPLTRGLEALAVSCAILPSGTDPVAFLVTMRDRWTRWLLAGQPGTDPGTIDRAARTSAQRLGGAADALVAATRGTYPHRWSGWVRAAGTAMATWERTLAPPALRGVFGSHLHMMANRLGVGAGGEAYLAAILLHLLASDPR